MMTDNKFIFFLGGHDAEMECIKDLLLSNKINKNNINDNSLDWGVKLSDYREDLEKVTDEQTAVLLELTIDDVKLLPKNNKIIDHHNEHSGADKPTSIEQVADLLQIKLNRWQEIISANDKDLFKGMQLIGATEDEIKNVNELEDKEQNIIKNDYKLAEESIKHFAEIIENEIIIINSLTKKTRPILQQLYDFENKCFKYQHIFILYKNESLNYTGTGELISTLIKKYKVLKEKDSSIEFWWGGYLPCRGYFGANKLLTKEEIIEIVKRPILSQHIFLFPFILTESKKLKSNDNGDNIYKKTISALRNNSGWKEKPFKFTCVIEDTDPVDNKAIYDEHEMWKYNEYNYFYEQVRKSLYIEDESTPIEDTTSHYFEKEQKPGSEFIISIKDDCKIYDYHLVMNNISLRIFENGIGILAITLYNYLYADQNSILKINDYGRRIYPQFLGKKGTEDTKTAFLPFKILIKYGSESIEEDFSTEKIMKSKYFYAEYISELLYPIKNFSSIIDDRMHTICWYGNNEIMSDLKQYDENSKTYNYENNRFWYMYTFVDGSFAGVANTKMRNQLINHTTYPRFVEYGTIFGISRYSFVCLTSRDDIPYNIVRNHLQKMYYQISVLVLAQRASIVKFNTEIAYISSQIKVDNSGKNKLVDVTQKIEKLSAEIIEFSNRIWQDEVTPQEQGIEIYQLAQKNMGIPEQLKSLQKRANELFSYHEMVNQRLAAKEVEILTRIGIVFLPLTLIAAIGAIEVDFIKTGANAIWNNLSTLGIFIGSFAFITLMTRNIILYLKNKTLKKDKTDKKNEDKNIKDKPLRLILISIKSFGTIFWLLVWLISLLIYFSNK